MSTIQRPFSADEILKLVADYWSIPMTELLDQTCRERIARTRGIAYYLIRKHTDVSLGDIAKLAKRSDHTVIIRGLRTAAKSIRERSDIAMHVTQLDQIIQAGKPLDVSHIVG